MAETVVTLDAVVGKLEDVELCWWIIGGLFGLVGLGSVNGSQKTTPLDDLSLLPALLLPPNIELCETPVEGARSIREAADGVAVCKIGLLISGLEVCTVGKVDDLGKD